LDTGIRKRHRKLRRLRRTSRTAKEDGFARTAQNQRHGSGFAKYVCRRAVGAVALIPPEPVMNRGIRPLPGAAAPPAGAYGPRARAGSRQADASARGLGAKIWRVSALASAL